VTVLAYTGMRWGELAGLKFGDRVAVPGPGLRLQRAALAGGGTGDLFIDSLKDHQSRTIPLTTQVIDIVERWSRGRATNEWMFPSLVGTPLREGNWKRAVGWNAAKVAVGRPDLRVHDLRHTAASIWLGSGADPKVVQRILGHASATMTMDLYGHLIDGNLWVAAKQVGGRTGATTEGRTERGNG
jgi:integrase